jgi:hypothetical protein
MMKYSWLLILIVLVSCGGGTDQSSRDYDALDKVMDKIASGDESSASGKTTGSGEKFNMAVAVEAIDAGTYTYVRLEEKGREFWAAITARPIEIGKTYAYSGAFLMKDFDSQQLGRTFDSVMFIQNFTETAAIGAENSDFQKSDPHAHTKTRMDNHIEVEPAADGETIAGIFSNLSSLENTQVTVKGQVVKISKNIMNRNWIHIQDGTQSGKFYDLTITSFEPVNFAVGDVITFTGKLSVDKDFGAGYRYTAILEDATWHEAKTL